MLKPQGAGQVRAAMREQEALSAHLQTARGLPVQDSVVIEPVESAAQDGAA